MSGDVSGGWRAEYAAQAVAQPSAEDCCPACGAPVRYREGCVECVACDWGRCQ